MKEIYFILISLSLTGCATTHCKDPSQGNVFDAVCGAMGGYEEGHREKRVHLHASKQHQQTAQQTNTQLISQYAQQQRTIQQLNQQINSLDLSIRQLHANISSLHTNSRATQQNKNAILQHLQRSYSEVTQIKQAPNKNQYSSYYKKIIEKIEVELKYLKVKTHDGKNISPAMAF
ncbi:hypothetical protein [Candidatus Venteria ishoeyi]|uniref:Lipoprotein n=1 Tax=Candidatus Venteria ishoeyi TaxID=1899563 RepID=A0A1H6F4I6_9GAMM|nr:hypothetical protein [Candidatus Venteria ishoeyi]SEH04179.1 Uncharacterised protein [Candidatus Venteria ishoeyi]